jgi:hypothetical protein
LREPHTVKRVLRTCTTAKITADLRGVSIQWTYKASAIAAEIPMIKSRMNVSIG